MDPLNLRTRLLLLFALALATFPSNVRAGGNIVHGVNVVVIDAGHGGKFPGAHYAGVYEKDLTLSVALKLGAMIEEGMPGVKVVYTRKTDKALSEDLAADLQARADIANRANGDLFISIHVNAARTPAAKGVETLIMGESSKEQRYNEGALYENNREDLIDMSDERTAAIVRAYIQNLQFTYGEYSMAMARCIQNNYQKEGRSLRGIKPQLLRVLYATDMPGVLTEIGFMSNPGEMAYMRSDKGQTEIARSLYRAVKDYSTYVLGTRGIEAGTVVAAEAPVDTVKEIPAAAEKSAAQKPAPETKPVKSAGKSSVMSSKSTQSPSAGSLKSAGTPSANPVRYTVQVLASPEIVSTASSRFKNYKGTVKQYSAEGPFRYKYCVGEYGDRAAAQKRLAEVRKVFPDAFVVRCQGTKIVK